MRTAKKTGLWGVEAPIDQIKRSLQKKLGGKCRGALYDLIDAAPAPLSLQWALPAPRNADLAAELAALSPGAHVSLLTGGRLYAGHLLEIPPPFLRPLGGSRPLGLPGG